MQQENNHNPMLLGDDEPLQLTATTLYGLENILAKELRQLGASNVEAGRRVVYFSGSKRIIYRANYYCRTALRILVPLVSFEAADTDALYQRCLRYPWHEILPPSAEFFIDTAVFSSVFTNSRYALYRLKDAIRDFASVRDGLQWSATDDRHCDVCLHLHINEKRVTISLDSSGESLHHRGYRTGYALAPLNELLAAGILLKAGYDGSQDLFDPMCGSGTFVAEAAMIASGTPAGRYRRDYAFRHWINYDSDLWASVRHEATPHSIRGRIIARDKDFKAIGTTTDTIRQMGFRDNVEILKEDFLTATPPSRHPLLIVLNPPYGKRVGHEDVKALYQAIGRKLKHEYAGGTVWMIASPVSLFDHIGLASESKEKLYNGELEAQLRCFRLFEGKKRDFKARETTRSRQPEHAPAEQMPKHQTHDWRRNGVALRQFKRFENAPRRERPFAHGESRPRRKSSNGGIQIFSFDENDK